MRFTEGQQTIINLGEKGHNICILGKASVGKSTAIYEIMRLLSARRGGRGGNAK